MTILDRIRARMVSDCRTVWRRWSTKLNAFGMALMASIIAAPDAMRAAWGYVPEDMRALVPWAPQIAMAIFAVTFAATWLKQKDPPHGPHDKR